MPGFKVDTFKVKNAEALQKAQRAVDLLNEVVQLNDTCAIEVELGVLGNLYRITPAYKALRELAFRVDLKGKLGHVEYRPAEKDVIQNITVRVEDTVFIIYLKAKP